LPGQARGRRLLVIGWGILGIALWNALFEMMVVRGVKDYLLRAELFAAGRGPITPFREVMDPAIHHAAWVASTWTLLVWVAAGLTVHYASHPPSDPRLEPRVGPGAARGDAGR
jgi:hypothetical protein